MLKCYPKIYQSNIFCLRTVHEVLTGTGREGYRAGLGVSKVEYFQRK